MISELNIARLYRAVTLGGITENEVVRTFTNTGEALKPYAVARPRASRDGSDNITLIWNRRSRLLGGFDLSHGTILGEASERYEIDVYDTGFTSLKRTITATSETASYTAAEQTTDFRSPQSSVGFRFYQMSPDVGRGHVTEAVL